MKPYPLNGNGGTLLFHSRFKPFHRWISALLMICFLDQQVYYAAAYDIDFSAVEKSNVVQKSEFFKPSEVKERAEKNLF